MDKIEFGKIVNTHGLKGEVKVYSYTDNVDNILKLKKVYIDNTKYTVEYMKSFKGMFLMKLKGIDKIEDTESILNKMCFREVEDNESNEEEGFFIRDLIGIKVYDEQDILIGTLKEVFKTGANDVYEIADENNHSIYLPAIKSVVLLVDIATSKMVVRLMKGLN